MDEKEGGVEELERMFTNESVEPNKISYSVIESITKNFYQEIGRGGYGTVYLGALKNDVMVAVKQLYQSNDLSDTQFLEEVNCLKRLNHKNIVRFLGYCAYTEEELMSVDGKFILAGKMKRLLCFEYAPNGNLHDYLQEKIHGHEWGIHYKIIKGICQGLHYLHQKRINHLDLKPANVLLGAQMEPKITDFGVSRCNDGTESTIFTTHLPGTMGYMAPELIGEGKISFKSDIYSLGVIMIRLLTGTNKEIPENWHESLNVECQLMERCVEIARICADNDPKKRPTISDILCMLTKTEALIQNVPPFIITEPGNDPTSTLYKNVKIFLARHPKTHEYQRGPKELRVERPKWKLAFHSPLKLPIMTDEKIEDANGNPLEVILLDADTDKPSALPDMLLIELVPLLGNFPQGCWDANDFQKGIVEDRGGKRPLLVGRYRLTMLDGRAIVNELMFMDDPEICGCMFRIGVRVVLGSYHGARILEAMTEAFMVRDRHEYELNFTNLYRWQLAFQCQPQLPIYLGNMIKDVVGNPLEVVLVDPETGSPSAGPMELDIQLVPVFDFFRYRGDMVWSANEFQRAIVEPQELLSGDVSLTMKDGRITVNELQFTGITGNDIRIGVRVVPGSYNGPCRILEGMTKAFNINDIPTEMKEKRDHPDLGDEVWTLDGMTWGGVFHKRLTQNNIRNVQDFLRMLAVKPDELRAIIGDGMEDWTWQQITKHARDCVVPVQKVYAYSTAHTTIYVNSIFELVEVEFGGVESPLQQLDEAQKRLVQQAMREAYEHCHSLQEVKLKLAFKNPPRLPIHTGSRITDSAGNPLEIILVKTGFQWTFPTELIINLVPLSGDFPSDDDKEDWSVEEFRAAIVEPRQENVPLLKSEDSYIIMNDWCATTSEVLQFTDDSSWVRCRKYRIGAFVVPDVYYDGTFRIIEAITEAFVVEDLNRKHYPPVLDDPVWRLEMIDKDGAVHRKLTSYNVDTVQEFLRMQNVKPDKLRAIVGDEMTGRLWLTATSHARYCDPGEHVYAYSGASGTIYVDSVFGRLYKIEMDGLECRLLLRLWEWDKAQTMFVQQLILKAYEHRHNLQEVCADMELRNDDDSINIFMVMLDAKYDNNDNDGRRRPRTATRTQRRGYRSPSYQLGPPRAKPHGK